MSKRWNFNKIVVLLLAATFVGLTIDLRYEHVDKVRRTWEAWIPIVYSGVMAVASVLGLSLWKRGGRQVLLIGFALSLIVGGLGFWFHNKRHPVGDVITVLQAWTSPEHHSDRPPTLAPLFFCFLGVLGVLACARGLQPVVPATGAEDSRP